MYNLCTVKNLFRLFLQYTKENDYILVKVIGIRYQLNDETVSVLAELTKNLGAKKIKVKK